MTPVATYDLPAQNNFSLNLSHANYAQSAKDFYLKREYTQLFTGVLIGLLLGLGGVYFYNKGGANIPRLGSPSTTDTGDRSDRSDRGDSSGGSDRGTQTGTLRVRGTSVRMRSCPGLNCTQVTILQEGTRVADLGRTQFIGDSQWIKVRAGSQQGWVDRFFLE